jgi:hypothetical protein
MSFLSENKIEIVIIVLLSIIIYLMFKPNQDGFQNLCKNGQCFNCKGKIYRGEYCYENKVERKCYNGYTLDDKTKLCKKKIHNEKKTYEVTAPPRMICKNDNIQIGNTCVSNPIYYFDPLVR